MMIDRQIVNFCAIECRLQQSGELSVAWMVDAWLYAQQASNDGWDPDVYRAPTVNDVLTLGKLVEPNDNALGFRKVDVRVGWDVKMNWENVPSATVNLMEALNEPPARYPDKGVSVPVLTPDTFFKHYEDIHPFRDGNGRSGVILFNWLNRTLDDPVWAPNFWNDPRRTVGHGA